MQTSDVSLNIKAAWPLRVFPPLLLLGLGCDASELLFQNRIGESYFWLGAGLLLVAILLLIIWAVAINGYSIRVNEQSIIVHDYPRTRTTHWSQVRFYEIWPPPRDPNFPSGLILLKDEEKVTVGTISLSWPISARARRQLINFIAQRATLIPTVEHPAKTRESILRDFKFFSFALLVAAVIQGYVIHYSLIFLALMLIIWLIGALQLIRRLRRWSQAHPMEIGGARSKSSPHRNR